MIILLAKRNTVDKIQYSFRIKVLSQLEKRTSSNLLRAYTNNIIYNSKKKIKYFRINLTKYVQHIYYKLQHTLMEDLHKLTDLPCSQIGSLHSQFQYKVKNQKPSSLFF